MPDCWDKINAVFINSACIDADILLIKKYAIGYLNFPVKETSINTNTSVAGVSESSIVVLLPYSHIPMNFSFDLFHISCFRIAIESKTRLHFRKCSGNFEISSKTLLKNPGSALIEDNQFLMLLMCGKWRIDLWRKNNN